MKERMIRKTSLGAQYVQSSYEGKNTSHINPVGDSCLVLIDDSVEKTKGNILLPDDMQERHKLAAETGVLVALGGGAFPGVAFANDKPKPGDRVYFQRYSGVVAIGQDEKEYRVMTYTCIGAVELGESAPATPTKRPKK